MVKGVDILQLRSSSNDDAKAEERRSKLTLKFKTLEFDVVIHASHTLSTPDWRRGGLHNVACKCL